MNKYRSRKTAAAGVVCDSGKEAKRYLQLLILQRAGEISELERQVPFELIPKQKLSNGKCERSCKYILDFRYRQEGVIIYEDSKGVKTPDYIIKRKLMLMIHGIEILET